MKSILTVFLKDLSIQTARGGVFLSVAVFAVVMASVLRFTESFPGAPDSRNAPALLWVCVLFSAVVAFERSFAAERKSEAMRMTVMTPVGGGAVFIAKTLANLVFLVAVEAVFIPVFTVLFPLDIALSAGRFALSVFAGTVGIAAAGTAISALSAQTDIKGVVFPVLLFPVLIPVLITASHAVSAAVGTGVEGDFHGYLKVLAGFDLAFMAAGALVYGYIIEEA